MSHTFGRCVDRFRHVFFRSSCAREMSKSHSPRTICTHPSSLPAWPTDRRHHPSTITQSETYVQAQTQSQSHSHTHTYQVALVTRLGRRRSGSRRQRQTAVHVRRACGRTCAHTSHTRIHERTFGTRCLDRFRYCASVDHTRNTQLTHT
jgi:hypothetical protein